MISWGEIMRLLIIEDNKKLADIMKEQLERSGYAVDLSNDGIDGEEKAYVNGYDVILLDLNLPDKDGLSILEHMRNEQIDTPVIIITARDETEQRVLGLDLGADDYIVKPFEFSELNSRIRAVIRRLHGRSNPEIHIGRLKITPSTRKVIIDEWEVPLSVKEYDIVEYMANTHPKIISNEEISEHVYDESFDPFSSVIRVHMSNIKKKLMVDGKSMLVNTKGKGYNLCER